MNNKIRFNVVKCVTDGNGYCSGKYYAQVGEDNGIHILRPDGKYLHDELFCTGGFGEGLFNNWDDSGTPSFVPVYPLGGYVEESDFNDYVAQCHQNAPEQPPAPENVKRHAEICKALNQLYAAKNADYGDSFHKSYEEWGLPMAAIRIGDKYNRFCQLIKNEAKVKDESIRDTLLDLADYAIMTAMEIDYE